MEPPRDEGRPDEAVTLRLRDLRHRISAGGERPEHLGRYVERAARELQEATDDPAGLSSEVERALLEAAREMAAMELLVEGVSSHLAHVAGRLDRSIDRAAHKFAKKIG